MVAVTYTAIPDPLRRCSRLGIQPATSTATGAHCGGLLNPHRHCENSTMRPFRVCESMVLARSNHRHSQLHFSITPKRSLHPTVMPQAHA